MIANDKIDFAGAWFDVCMEYLRDREAFLQSLKEPVGVGMMVAPVADSIDSPSSGSNGVHQLYSIDDLTINKNLDDLAQKRVGSDTHAED